MEFSTQGKSILMGEWYARTEILNDYIDLDHISKTDEDILPSDYLEYLILRIRNNIDSCQWTSSTLIGPMHGIKATNLKWKNYWWLYGL